ncbi:hypothetical protein HK103_004224 [Boothiomyces macroporosus]|uniref:Uncharacterized protein n=1 Tax=Boothiomyces macroporosus TaxID=261099 RepID=A0AAD5Y8N4_9FUNG|nr:hypothetical protein HK103_004224 [Boothiomyces macroporosus]
MNKVWEFAPITESFKLDVHGEVKLTKIYEDSLIFTTNHNMIYVWDFQKSKIVERFPAHSVSCLDVDDRVIVTGSYDRNIKVWENSKCKYTLSGHLNSVTNILLVGSLIFSAGQDGKLLKWEMKSNTPVKLCANHKCRILKILLVEEYIVTVSTDGNMILWDIDLGILQNVNTETNPTSICLFKKKIILTTYGEMVLFSIQKERFHLHHVIGFKNMLRTVGTSCSDYHLLISGLQGGKLIVNIISNSFNILKVREYPEVCNILIRENTLLRIHNNILFIDTFGDFPQ